jgi:hypothetical protein
MVGLLEVSKRVKGLLPLMRAMYLGNSDGVKRRELRLCYLRLDTIKAMFWLSGCTSCAVYRA